MLSKFFERILLQNAFLGLPLLGSYPWGRVDAPQMSGWVWKFSRLLLVSFPASFVKRILL